MKINKEITRLAIPNILSNISVPLISSVDTGLMGHLSANHLAAVGSSAMIFNFIYWNFGFLRMGTTGLVAQAFGANNNYEKSRVFFQALLVALLIASALFVLQGVIGNTAFGLMNLDEELTPLASEYFFTRIWDAPATLILYILMAWFFGNQNAIIPLILTIVINVTNLTLSIYFVNSLEMGIHGVALGSVIANYVGVITGFLFIYFRVPLLKIAWGDLFLQLARYWKLNRDIFFRTLMLSLTFGFLYSSAATYGPVILAVNVIILQFTNWMSYAIDGFAYASESLVGKYKGAKDEASILKTIKSSMEYGFVFAILFSLCYSYFTMEITSFFTNDEEVILLVNQYKYWISVIPLLGFVSYIWDGVFVGLTASKAMRNTMFVSFVVFIISYYSTRSFMGYSGLLLALCLYLVSRAIAQTIVFYRKGIELQ